MIGTLSQMVVLCSAVNGRIAGRFSTGDFYPRHAEFKFCNDVSFVQCRQNWLGKPIESRFAPDPNAWIEQLALGKATRCTLHHAPTPQPQAPDHKLVAFVGGGGDWTLSTHYRNRIDRWMSRWEITQSEDPARRIWTVTYGLVMSGKATPAPREPTLEGVSQQFKAVLKEASEFAYSHALEGFGNAFDRGLLALDVHAEPTFPDYVDFICLNSYPKLALQLFAAAYAAWVFGGMGSWNDLWFDKPVENQNYEDISAKLYRIMNSAIQVAANSFQLP